MNWKPLAVKIRAAFHTLKKQEWIVLGTVGVLVVAFELSGLLLPIST